MGAKSGKFNDENLLEIKKKNVIHGKDRTEN